MDLAYRSLKETDFPETYRTFIEAFSDYALNMKYMNETVLYNRAVKNGIVFDCSVGAFRDGNMVGFTLVGCDKWQGTPSAFDIATGITKACRGRGVARRMFDTIVPRLRERGVTQFLLEVLRENEPAVKAYTKAGFRITREFECFRLDLEKPVNDVGASSGDIEIHPIDKEDIVRYRSFFDWTPSWENSIASIRRIPDAVHAFTATSGDDPAGVIVYYPGLNWIMTLAVDPIYRRQGIGTALLRQLLRTVPVPSRTVKLNNVQADDHAFIAFLEQFGFEKYASQYEMALQLASEHVDGGTGESSNT